MRRDTWVLGHRPALDGLRGIAIVAVLLLHFGPTTFLGGGLGVDLFFVLSGFLITRKLIEEDREFGGISIRRFCRARVRRLMPAMLAVVATCATASGAIWTLLYVANWSRAFGGMRGPLEHTWSLAIEEQFYIVWPIVFLGIRRIGHAAWWLVAGALGVCLWRVHLAGAASSTMERVVNGTDMRADALLIGAAIAFGIQPLMRIDWRRIACVVALPLLVLVCGMREVELIGVGYTMVGAACAVLVLGALQSKSGWLDSMVLTWLGRTSYSLYLWHYPILYLARGGDLYRIEFASTAVAVLASFAVAAASARWVEAPLRLRSVAHAPQRQRHNAKTFDAGWSLD